MIKKRFKILDMHCSSCALSIDMDLEDLEGVKMARTSYARQECEIECDPTKLDDKKIIEIIKKTGYSALPLE